MSQSPTGSFKHYWPSGLFQQASSALLPHMTFELTFVGEGLLAWSHAMQIFMQKKGHTPGRWCSTQHSSHLFTSVPSNGGGPLQLPVRSHLSLCRT
ncbi:unnamed protein product [Arctogadus glacialis]